MSASFRPGYGVLVTIWRLHRWYFTLTLTLWLLMVWVGDFAVNPLYCFFVGLILAFLGGSTFGGTDAHADVVEFANALPVHRRKRFWIIFFAGLLPVLFFSAGSYAASRFSLPQSLWGSVFGKSILTEPWDSHDWILSPFHLVILTGPFFVYCLFFSFCSFARNPQALERIRRYVLFLSVLFFFGYLSTTGMVLCGKEYEFPLPLLVSIACSVMVVIVILSGYRWKHRDAIGIAENNKWYRFGRFISRIIKRRT